MLILAEGTDERGLAQALLDSSILPRYYGTIGRKRYVSLVLKESRRCEGFAIGHWLGLISVQVRTYLHPNSTDDFGSVRDGEGYNHTQIHRLRSSKLKSAFIFTMFTTILLSAVIAPAVVLAHPATRVSTKKACAPLDGDFIINNFKLYPENADWDPVNCKLYAG